MTALPRLDDLIQSVSLYNRKSTLFHLYIFPFLIFYSSWIYFWISFLGINEFYEEGLIIIAGIGCAQILCILACYWSVHVNCFFTCNKVSDSSVKIAIHTIILNIIRLLILKQLRLWKLYLHLIMAVLNWFHLNIQRYLLWIKSDILIWFSWNFTSKNTHSIHNILYLLIRLMKKEEYGSFFKKPSIFGIMKEKHSVELNFH